MILKISKGYIAFLKEVTPIYVCSHECLGSCLAYKITLSAIELVDIGSDRSVT